VEDTAPSSFVAIRRSLNELNSSDPILLSFKLWGVKLTVVLLCSCAQQWDSPLQDAKGQIPSHPVKTLKERRNSKKNSFRNRKERPIE